MRPNLLFSLMPMPKPVFHRRFCCWIMLSPNKKTKKIIMLQTHSRYSSVTFSLNARLWVCKQQKISSYHFRHTSSRSHVHWPLLSNGLCEDSLIYEKTRKKKRFQKVWKQPYTGCSVKLQLQRQPFWDAADFTASSHTPEGQASADIFWVLIYTESKRQWLHSHFWIRAIYCWKRPLHIAGSQFWWHLCPQI